MRMDETDHEVDYTVLSSKNDSGILRKMGDEIDTSNFI